MSGEAPSDQWYVRYAEDEVRGPCDVTVLKTLLDDCVIDGLTAVWKNGMDAWLPLSQVPKLKELLNNDLEAVVETMAAGAGAQTANVENENAKDANDADATTEDDEKRRLKREKKRLYLQRKKMRLSQGQWIDSAKNTSVYVTNLPLDTTQEELASVFKRAGVLKIDPMSLQPKIKLYTDDQGKNKGDARVTYANPESVEFAIKYLNDYEFRPGFVINVQEARFEPQKKPNSSGPAYTAKNPEFKRRYLAAKYEEQRLQCWSRDVDEETGKRIVICKFIFSYKQAQEHEADDVFYQQVRDEWHKKVEQLVPVEKTTPIARHPQGIVCFKFATDAQAKVFIAEYNNRKYNGRTLECYFFDGKTDLQAQTLPPNKVVLPEKTQVVQELPECDWIEEQSSDEEFEIKTES